MYADWEWNVYIKYVYMYVCINLPSRERLEWYTTVIIEEVGGVVIIDTERFLAVFLSCLIFLLRYNLIVYERTYSSFGMRMNSPLREQIVLLCLIIFSNTW
jgi:hypothetical protein